MLDIYFLADSCSMPDDPKDELYAGSLTLEQHKALGCVWKCCERQNIHLEFFSDSRLNSKQVKAMLECSENCCEQLKESEQITHAYEILQGILGRIAERDFGLIAFCD